MDYTLHTDTEKKRSAFRTVVTELLPLMLTERLYMALASFAILLNSVLTLVAPWLVGRAVDTYIRTGEYQGVLMTGALLGLVYVGAYASAYVQTRMMGGVGRRVLYRLRNAIFHKLQELPLTFFNANKAGDLISRINNDTDKLNQFFAQALMQFIGSIFLIIGAGIFLVVMQPQLGIAALLPALGIVLITQILSSWVERVNLTSLRSIGSMSGEIQESLANFKVIVAFNRIDYFRTKFNDVNTQNYKASVSANIANNFFTPIYSFASNMAQLIVLTYGIYLIGGGALSIGILVSFFLYVNNFYQPLRQMASVWSSLQQALAALDRISEVLSLPNVPAVSASATEKGEGIMEFRDVSFRYTDGKEVLSRVSFVLEPQKTYALVGPTGGGKTTTASLMANLFAATEGKVFLAGRDIRSYEGEERTQKIGFILQEPFLFSGDVAENIRYGNETYAHLTNDELNTLLTNKGLGNILERFPQGLSTLVAQGGETISLGQKQLIAFIRAVLREPDLLILDEATANIDTVTEQLLEEILSRLPKKTTKVIIAHRLNTIQNADEIFFVNGGTITAAGSMEHALDLLMHGTRSS